MEFTELKNEVVAAGLYKKNPWKYIVHFTLIMLGVAASCYLLMITDNLFVQILNGVFFGSVLVQAGLLGHDFSHQQVFSSAKYNSFCAAVIWGLFGGLSEGGWYEKHNAHHKHVNHEGLDPDLNIPFIFAAKQSPSKHKFIMKYVAPYQHFVFFMVLPFAYSTMMLWSFKTVFSSFSLKNILEATLMIVHFVLLIGVPLLFLPVLSVVGFCLAMFFTIGLYMGVAFAPNHKGQEVLHADDEHDWTHQITLTRNIRYSPFVFHFFGGLDLQIEHHLFPDMPRYNYRKAQVFVKSYCIKHDLTYHETTWFGSMKEIYLALKVHAA